MKQNPIVHEVSPEVIMQLMDRELPAKREAELAAHLDDCSECRNLIEEFRMDSSQLAAWEIKDSGQAQLALEELRIRVAKQRGWRTILRPRYAAAFCAVVLALTVWAELSPSRIHVDEQTVRTKLIKAESPTPKYPEEARRNNTQGDVILRIVVARNGTVKQLHVIEGDPVLAKAALEGVRRWKFRPTVVDGKSVEVESEIKVQFTLLP